MSLITPLVSGGLRRSVPALLGVADPTVAVNASAFEEYSASFAMLDISKKMDNWGSASGDQDWAITNGYIGADGGWITNPATPVVMHKTINLLQSSPWFIGRQCRMRWTGTGTLSVSSGATTDSTGSNEITFTVTGPFLQIGYTAESGTITGMDIVETQYTSRFDAGEYVHPEYLDIIKEMREVRFMDWAHTNASLQTTWGTRSVIDQNSYVESGAGSLATHKKGVPIELMVEVCNRIKADMWYCFPADCTYSGADADNYVLQALTYIEANLDTDLKVTLEISNEVWNGGFATQISQLAALSDALWPNASGESEYYRAQNALGWKTWQMDQIAQTVFAGQLDRYKVTMNVNVGNYISALEAPLWNTHAGDANATSGAYVQPSTICDSLAITGYFGTALGGNGPLIANIVAAYPDTSDSLIDSYLRTDDEANIFGQPNLFNGWDLFNGYATTYGLDMIMYEGGPHMVYSNPNSTYQAAIEQWVASSLGATFLTECYDRWAILANTAGPYMQFWDVDFWTGFGTWSLWQGMDDTPTGFMGQLLTENAGGSNWWGDSRDFRHGAL